MQYTPITRCYTQPAVTLPIKENIPLAPLTTLGIGGPARFFAEASSEDDVLDAVTFAQARGAPMVVIGGGSNLLVSDDGFPGLILRIAIPGIALTDLGDRVCMQAGAGEDWDGFVAECVDRGLHGVECLSGIPGWVGGTPVQNVGAYGQEVSEVISRVRVYDRASGGISEMRGEDCGFGYRKSLFNTTARGRYVVLRVDYVLSRAGRSPLAYPDFERFFRDRDHSPAVREVREAVRIIRKSKAMLLIDGDLDCRSAGSFFKNPIVSESAIADIEAGAARCGCVGSGEGIPRFRAGAGQTKVPAAWLIERAGFRKGFARGSVGLSERHALALINRGGARARDVLELASDIQRAVEHRFGVRLMTEPAFLGFPDAVLEDFGAVSA